MPEYVSDIMTQTVTSIRENQSVLEAAKLMQSESIGVLPVLSENDQHLSGVLTDRDIVTRVVAEGSDPAETTVSVALSKSTHTLDSSDTVDQAISLMRKYSIRRAPVMRNGSIVGILSLGDLAAHRDPKSVLGQISSAPAQN